MKNRKQLSFPLIIIAVVLGITIYKDFDFSNFKFEKPLLDIIYILTFLMTVYFIFRKEDKNSN